jgi:hypothetical protein
MGKYKLLIEANQYSYKTVDAPELSGGNGTKEIKDKLLYSIPIGTIIEAEPSKFNGGDNDDFPNSFQVSLKKDTDKYPIFLSNVRDVKNNRYYSKDLELVPNDTNVTLDKNIKVLNVFEPSQFKTPTQTEVVSDFEYYTSAKFLKSASVSIVPVALIGAYSYHKKFSLTKTALLVSIPIVAITGLQYLFMGGGKNKYWSIFSPPSVKANRNAQLREIEKRTGMPQKG